MGPNASIALRQNLWSPVSKSWPSWFHVLYIHATENRYLRHLILKKFIPLLFSFVKRYLNNFILIALFRKHSLNSCNLIICMKFPKLYCYIYVCRNNLVLKIIFVMKYSLFYEITNWKYLLTPHKTDFLTEKLNFLTLINLYINVWLVNIVSKFVNKWISVVKCVYFHFKCWWPYK